MNGDVVDSFQRLLDVNVSLRAAVERTVNSLRLLICRFVRSVVIHGGERDSQCCFELSETQTTNA